MAELGLNVPSLISYLINYIVLLILLGVFAYRHLLNALDTPGGYHPGESGGGGPSARRSRNVAFSYRR